MPTLTPGVPVSAIDAILRRREVEMLVGFSRSTIYRRMARNEFPRPVDLGGGMVGWRESAIDAYLQALPPRAYR